MRKKLGQRFNTSGHQLSIATEEFEYFHDPALKLALDEYDKLGHTSKRAENELWLNLTSFSRLEYDITRLQIEADNNRRLSVSRKIATFAGLGIAAVAGGLTAIADGAGKGNHHWSWLATAGISGSVIGYGAAKISTSGHRYETLNRISAGEERIQKDGMTVLGATKSLTEKMQTKKLRKIGRMVLLGVGVAAITHLAVDYGPGLVAKGIKSARSVDIGRPDTGRVEIGTDGTDTAGIMEPTAEPTVDQPVSTATVEPTPEPTGTSEPIVQQEATEPPQPTVEPTIEPSPTEIPVEPTIEPTEPPEPTPTEPVESPPIEPTDSGNDASAGDGSGETAETSPGSDFNVEYGNGFTQELQDYAKRNGINLSAADSYELYQYLVDMYGPDRILTDAEVYRMPNGDWGISDPGSASWAPGVQDTIDKWMAKRGL